MHDNFVLNKVLHIHFRQMYYWKWVIFKLSFHTHYKINQFSGFCLLNLQLNIFFSQHFLNFLRLFLLFISIFLNFLVNLINITPLLKHINTHTYTTHTYIKYTHYIISYSNIYNVCMCMCEYSCVCACVYFLMCVHVFANTEDIL